MTSFLTTIFGSSNTSNNTSNDISTQTDIITNSPSNRDIKQECNLLHNTDFHKYLCNSCLSKLYESFHISSNHHCTSHCDKYKTSSPCGRALQSDFCIMLSTYIQYYYNSLFYFFFSKEDETDYNLAYYDESEDDESYNIHSVKTENVSEDDDISINENDNKSFKFNKNIFDKKKQ